jgi:NADH dehydrogenase
MALNIPSSDLPRLVIIGAGFAGLELAKRMKSGFYQIVILDKNNYHQFQPLFYQVSMAGLEPSSITFPIRKLFQRKKDVYIRPVVVEEILHEKKRIRTSEGEIFYDKLVIATGAITNFYGNDKIESKALTLKSISESLYLRNEILSDLETALTKGAYSERQKYIDIVIVGGGPTGVEIAGALAEMRNYIIPKDYPELDESEVDIYLIQAGDRLLNTMSEKASKKASKFLKDLGVEVRLNSRVVDYDGHWVELENGEKLETKKLIWCAGVKATKPFGLPADCVGSGGRLIVDGYNEVNGVKEVFAVGDVAMMCDREYPHGHPQVAQVAVQQARLLARNLMNDISGKTKTVFQYLDKGSMATIGRNKAVADISGLKFAGWFAWVIWLVVHLFALIGVKNKVIVFLNWIWNYWTYDQSLRLIIRPFLGSREQRD